MEKTKNCWLIPTDKPSRLVKLNCNSELRLSKENFGNPAIYQNIYITSDEEIKEGDWFYCFQNNNVLKCFKKEGQLLNGYHTIYKKIILTTDQELIKDGVQSIDDEFLEWFVKNPSCEEVEIELDYDNGLRIIDGKNLGYYSYIIPKEEPTEEAKQRAENYMSLKGALEPKQETLEEFIRKESKSGNESVGIIKGAKWQQEQYGLMEIELSHTKRLLASCEKALEDRDKQQERMYSEEEVDKLISDFKHDLRESTSNYVKQNCEGAIFGLKRLKQFKKK